MPTPRRIIGLAAVGLLALCGCSATGNLARSLYADAFGTGSEFDAAAGGPSAGEIDGAIGLEVTHVPALARLDPSLLGALQAAAADARASGISVYVTSGWRSASYQQRLLDEAIATYGSAGEAARWVHPPSLSKHVVGQAVDVGPADAVEWLIRYGNQYGLCQTYANERWHFELATAPGDQCQPMLGSPAEESAAGVR